MPAFLLLFLSGSSRRFIRTRVRCGFLCVVELLDNRRSNTMLLSNARADYRLSWELLRRVSCGWAGGVRGVAFIFALLFISGIFVMNVNNGRGLNYYKPSRQFPQNVLMNATSSILF